VLPLKSINILDNFLGSHNNYMVNYVFNPYTITRFWF